MAKISAFGTVLNVGIQQIDTATIVGTITGSGNATVTYTAAGMTGSPIARSVAVLNGDTPDTVATKIVADALGVANITNWLNVSCSGALVTIQTKNAAANDATLNLAFTNGTCTGLTPGATSANTLAGVAMTPVAFVQKIGGPKLSSDTEDVTTHDQATAWEEEVVTLLHTGEISLEIVYDPNAASHAAASGLLGKLQNKNFAQFGVVFPGPYTWTMSGYCTGFEPDEPVDGALTAKLTVKPSGAPVLV